jgi:tagatose 6-phosphate kinase
LGSIPADMSPGTFELLIDSAHKAGVPVLVDSSSQGILSALPAVPDILKMNAAEFKEAIQVEASTPRDLKLRGAEIFQEHHLKTLVITCADEGRLAFTAQGLFHALAPHQVVVNYAGAGDAPQLHSLGGCHLATHGSKQSVGPQPSAQQLSSPRALENVAWRMFKQFFQK